jgi:hypothetical protein
MERKADKRHGGEEGIREARWSQGRFYVFKGLRANLTMNPYGYIYI